MHLLPVSFGIYCEALCEEHYKGCVDFIQGPLLRLYLFALVQTEHYIQES